MNEITKHCTKDESDTESAPPISVTRFLQTSGISSVTFWRWEKRGVIQTVRLAGRKYITATAMKEFNRKLAAGDLSGATQNPHENGKSK